MLTSLHLGPSVAAIAPALSPAPSLVGLSVPALGGDAFFPFVEIKGPSSTLTLENLRQENWGKFAKASLKWSDLLCFVFNPPKKG